MKGTNTITINGQLYDAVTGLPVSAANRPSGKVFSDIGRAKTVTPRPSAPTHNSMHKQITRSQTLNRSAVKRPQPAIHRTSPNITKFAPHPSGVLKQKAQPVTVKTVPQTIHTAVKEVAPAQHPNQQLKNQLIKERIAQAETQKAEHKKSKSRKITIKPRFASIASVSFALLILGGYLTYINLPNLSVRVAAAQAGIDASYPEYHPDGYSMNGPVAYSPGEVTMNFKSNSNDRLAYAIKQQASSWDSQAVLDNFVSKKSQNYTTYSEQGLTIYTYGDNAAWVNGGILYTVDGNAPLSSDQVLKIAGSL